MLCLFLLGMVCNVAWAQETETYTVEKQTTKPTNGYYVIYSESSSGKGWVHYDSSLDRKFRVATDKDFKSGVPADETMYIWKLQNGSDDTFTLQCLNEGVYIPADAGANQNMKGTTTANLALTEVVNEGIIIEGEWYISQTNYPHSVDGQPAATTYIHTNTPGGYPNLSYWPSTSPDGTSIRAQFFKITSLEPADLEVIYKFNDEVLEEYNVNTFLVKGSPYTIQNPLSNKYLTIAECDVNGTPLEAVDGEFVTTINDATTITVTLKEELPFRVSTDFNSATWYYMQINSGGWEFVRNNGEAPYTNTTNRSDLNEGCQWAFVGDALNGFKILNKTAGANQTLSFDGTVANGTVAKMKEEDKLWTIEKGNGGFVIRQGADECLNDFNDELKIWKDPSSPQGAGSAFRVLSTSVTELTNWNNLSYYVLNAERSPLIYSTTEGKTTKLSSGMVDGISHNVDDINQQFIIARTSSIPEGYYYLYSMGAKKFVGADLSFTDFPEPILSFEPSGDKLYPWFVKINDKYVVPGANGTDGNKVYHVETPANDDGKRYQIVDAQKAFDWENDMSIFTSIERAEGMLTEGSQLRNDKVYTVSTYDRGYWYYLEGKDAMWSTVKAGVDVNNSDPEPLQFAFLTVAEKTYLYSVGAKKFVVKSGNNTAYSDDPTQEVVFLKGQGSKFYPFVVAFVDGENQHQIAISNTYDIPIITYWNDLDDPGNTVEIREVDDYDFTDVVTKIEEYLIETTLKSGLTDLITEANELKLLFDQDVQDQLTAAVTAAQNVLAQDSPTADELNEQITLLTNAINSVKYVREITGFQNGYVYTFVTKRGWMGAKEGNNNVISTAKAAHNLTGEKGNANFQWTVYTSESGRKYLYNIGKGQFMGLQTANNTSVPFVTFPTGLTFTFKKSNVAEYPIMYSTDNSGVVNHSADHGDGVVTWTGGWNNLNDEGSNHKVAIVNKISDETLNAIAATVTKAEAYDALVVAYNQVAFKIANLNEALGYYSTTSANPTETFAALEVRKNAVTEETELSNINKITDDLKEFDKTFSLNVPETGKFYRFKHNYGGEVGELYVQAQVSNASGKGNAMLMSGDKDAVSIFYYADAKLLSYSQGLYVKESGDTRGLQSVGAEVGTAKFEAGTVGGKLGIFAGDSFHANESNGIRFIDHCPTVHNSAHDFTVEEVTTLPVTVSSVGVATLYTPVALEIPADVNVYTAVQEEENNVAYLKLQLVETGYIPANTGVILEAEAGTYDFKVTDEEVTEFGAEENVLTGKCETSNMRTDVKVYTLQKPTGRDLGFYLFNGTKAITGFRSWLELPNDSPVLSFRFKFGTTTDIESLVTLQNAKAIYDLSGRRVENMDKGIYIVNGKKIVVK
ncbi:MAG: FIVAR domain-containing protein [Bacteroidaceae bacterium]|nr:FIVAR domain-containing protein [Bacteroidaceae bacterium]